MLYLIGKKINIFLRSNSANLGICERLLLRSLHICDVSSHVYQDFGETSQMRIINNILSNYVL